MLPRIFIRCPDYDEPSGGVRRLYRHVDVLRRNGYEAWLLHQQRGFRCSWFPNQTPIITSDQVTLTASDYLVVPEIDGPNITRLAPGIPKIIFNQNAYLTFPSFPLNATGFDPASVYLAPDVAAVFTVSDGNTDLLRYAFPTLNLIRLHYGIDPIFSPRWPKRRQLAFMPRKNASDGLQALHLLKCRHVLPDWEIAVISGLKEEAVARCLSESMLFMALGSAEGCPLPPLEAMASGCVVVGYHGQGGREYLDTEFSRPVEAGDILGIARAVEELTSAEQSSPGTLKAMGRRAEAFIRTHYSPEREEQDIVQAWRKIIERRYDRV